MELCSKKHEQVCYEYGACPLCELEDKNELLREKVEELTEELEELRGDS